MLYKQQKKNFQYFYLISLISFHLKVTQKKRKSSLKEIGIKNGLIEKEWNKYVKYQNINYS